MMHPAALKKTKRNRSGLALLLLLAFALCTTLTTVIDGVHGEVVIAHEQQQPEHCLSSPATNGDNNDDDIGLEGAKTNHDGTGTSCRVANAAMKDQQLQQVVNRFTETYREAAKFTVERQADSWREIMTNEHDIRSDEEIELAQLEENILEKYGAHLKTLRDHIHGMAGQSSSSSSDHGQCSNNTTAASTIDSNKNLIGPQPIEPLIWDEETTIDSYLSSLSHYCSRSRNATEDPEAFQEECWGLLHALVTDPICTARMDSRYVCNGEEWKQYHKDDDDQSTAGARLLSTPPLEPRRRFTAEQIIQQHLTDDTLNIVIIGAGPVGLFLANALIGATTSVKIRVLMFEKRIEYPGRKKQYTRNWMTALSFHTFDELIDERIAEYLDMIVRDEGGRDYVENKDKEEDDDDDDDDDDDVEYARRFVSIPTNAIETLLLLANRDAGVKFLFDNFQDYREVLETVPNLVVFDATGHRLDSLDLKGKTDDVQVHEAAVNVTVFKWPTELQWDIEGKEYDKTTFRYDNIVAEQVTDQGSILYPVHMNGAPLKCRAFDTENFLHGAKVGGIYFKWVEQNVQDNMMSNHPLCTTEMEWKDKNADKKAFDPCRLSRFYDQSTYLRPDMEQLARVIDPPYDNTGLAIYLSDEQHDALQYILSSPLPPSWSTENSSVRFVSLPIEGMMHTPIFRKNNLVQTLAFVMDNIENREEETARTHLYSYKPFVYMDALVPITVKDHPGRIGTAPLLRIGDSLFSGNADLGTGMELGFELIYEFISEIEFGQLDRFYHEDEDEGKRNDGRV